jgi:hypothetical protein
MCSFSDRSRQLVTNQLSCEFEVGTGFLRKVMHGEIEILRAIYGAVRDQNWNTVEPKLAIRRFETRENQFYLQFDADCAASGVAFWWSGLIEADGPRLTFQFIGKAKSTFRKNRIGLCVLHPIHGCAGSSCMTQDIDHDWANSSFPEKIAPHQPFKNLRGLRWWPGPGIEAEIRFSGEIFETEDQRNWTDASFKTYCTPLEQPYPVLIEEGTAVEQAVTLEIRSERRFFSVRHEIPEIDLESDFDTPMPPLGLCVASHGQALTELELSRLRSLRLNHLRVDLHLAQPNWRTNYERAAAEALAIGAGLQVALFLTDDGHRELREFRDTIDLAIIRSCLVFHEREISTSQNWLESAEALLEGSVVAGGTNAYFAELNRNRPPQGYPAAYSINPQVHAFDDRTLIENLEAQSATIESALRLCPEGLFLSPITLRPRFNPNATAELIEPEGELPSAVDRRQRMLVGACWTAGSLAALSRCHGVTALTYFETTGWRGLMETSRGSPLSDRFGSAPNEIFPLFYVFEFLAGATSVLALSAAPDGLAFLGLRDASGSRRYIITNLETIPKRIRCRFSGSGLEVCFLSEANVDQQRKGTPLKMAVYQVVGGSVEIDLPAMSIALVRPNAE